jgi:hypothetical protein
MIIPVVQLLCIIGNLIITWFATKSIMDRRRFDVVPVLILSLGLNFIIVFVISYQNISGFVLAVKSILVMVSFAWAFHIISKKEVRK